MPSSEANNDSLVLLVIGNGAADLIIKSNFSVGIVPSCRKHLFRLIWKYIFVNGRKGKGAKQSLLFSGGEYIQSNELV